MGLVFWQISAIIPLLSRPKSDGTCFSPQDRAYYYLVTVANLEPVQKFKIIFQYLIISSPQSLVTCLTGRNELCVSCVRDYHF